MRLIRSPLVPHTNYTGATPKKSKKKGTHALTKINTGNNRVMKCEAKRKRAVKITDAKDAFLFTGASTVRSLPPAPDTRVQSKMGQVVASKLRRSASATGKR